MSEQKKWTENIGDDHFQEEIGPYIIDQFNDYQRGDKAIPEDFNDL